MEDNALVGKKCFERNASIHSINKRLKKILGKRLDVSRQYLKDKHLIKNNPFDKA